MHDSAGAVLATLATRPLDTFRQEVYDISSGKPQKLNLPERSTLRGMLGRAGGPPPRRQAGDLLAVRSQGNVDRARRRPCLLHRGGRRHGALRGHPADAGFGAVSNLVYVGETNLWV